MPKTTMTTVMDSMTMKKFLTATIIPTFTTTTMTAFKTALIWTLTMTELTITKTFMKMVHRQAVTMIMTV